MAWVQCSKLSFMRVGYRGTVKQSPTLYWPPLLLMHLRLWLTSGLQVCTADLSPAFYVVFWGFFCELSSRIHNAFFTVLLSVSSSHFCTHIWELPWPNCGILLWVLLNLITFLWTHFSSSYRITAWLVLEGTLKRLKCLSVFKRLGTSATILGSLFQCSTIFTVKKCFPVPSLNLSWNSFVPLFHFLSLVPRSGAQHLPLLPLFRELQEAIRSSLRQPLFVQNTQPKRPQPLFTGHVLQPLLPPSSHIYCGAQNFT